MGKVKRSTECSTPSMGSVSGASTYTLRARRAQRAQHAVSKSSRRPARRPRSQARAIVRMALGTLGARAAPRRHPLPYCCAGPQRSAQRLQAAKGC